MTCPWCTTCIISTPDCDLGAAGLEVVEALRPKMKLSTSVDLIPNPAPALSRRMEKKNKRRAAELRAKKAAGTMLPIHKNSDS